MGEYLHVTRTHAPPLEIGIEGLCNDVILL